MTETQFIEENKAKWQELENLLTRKDKDPDKLHILFVKVSSDLAYASTFYPKRSVRAYLNQLTQQVFVSMEDKKTEWSLDLVKKFFGHLLPSEMYRSRKALLASFLIFSVAVIIGVVSSANNPDFLAVVVGEDYVEMTNENINKGDPMAVYKDSEQSDMFFAITINNIRVSFLCFILGIFGSLGTIIVLFSNGIMLGSFQYFFYAKGLFVESFLTIWIHGTIEISAIIIAGAAGIVLGNGLLFPKTYSRVTSLQISAKRAVRIIIGAAPLFVIAGFLESFVTRLTGLPSFVKLLIILISLAYILGMYVIYPWWYHKYVLVDKGSFEIVPDKVEPLHFQKDNLRSFTENMSLALSQFRTHFGLFFSHAVTPLLLFLIGSLTFYQKFITENIDYNNEYGLLFYVDHDIVLLNIESGGLFMFIIYWLSISYAFLILSMIYIEEKLTLTNKLAHIKYYFIGILLITLIPMSILYFVEPAWILALFLFVPPIFFAKMIHIISEDGWSAWKQLSHNFKLSYQNWIGHMTAVIIVMLLHLMLFLILDSSIGNFIFDFFYWHELFEGLNVTRVIILTIAYSLVHIIIMPLYFYLLLNFYYSEEAKKNATDLWNRFEKFHQQSSIFEAKT
ncbi:MAG: putative membrane protein SpoIIM required for sporulation [Saprospiraceae bacterium]